MFSFSFCFEAALFGAAFFIVVVRKNRIYSYICKCTAHDVGAYRFRTA